MSMDNESNAVSEPISHPIEPSTKIIHVEDDEEDVMTLNKLLTIVASLPHEIRTRFVKCLRSKKEHHFESHRAFARHHYSSPQRFKDFMKNAVTWEGTVLTKTQTKKIFVYCKNIKKAKKSKKTQKTTTNDKDAQTDFDIDEAALPFDSEAMAANNGNNASDEDDEDEEDEEDDEKEE